MQTFGNDFQPDVMNVSEIRSLDYLIREYPNEDLIPQFKKLQQTYPCYRAIRGDGNCFYRAIAFLYLREANLTSFSNIFEDIQNFCIGHSLQFEDVTFKEKLKQLYNNSLWPIRNTTVQNRQQHLAECWNKSIVFDMIMVMYFRSLNYKYIKEHEQDFISFVTSRDTIERVRRYGMDSEGIEYESMAKALNVQIEMKITDQLHVKSQIYNASRSNKSFEIFFRPGHFDLLYHKDSPYLKQFLESQRYSKPSKMMTQQGFDSMEYLQSRQNQRNYDSYQPKKQFPPDDYEKRDSYVQKSKTGVEKGSKSLKSSTLGGYLRSPLSALDNLRKTSTKEPSTEKQLIKPTKKQQKIDEPKEKLFQSNSFSPKASIPTEKYREFEGQGLNQRQPNQRIKEALTLLLFIGGLSYMFFKF